MTMLVLDLVRKMRLLAHRSLAKRALQKKLIISSWWRSVSRKYEVLQFVASTIPSSRLKNILDSRS
jgi:hypothetical protein